LGDLEKILAGKFLVNCNVGGKGAVAERAEGIRYVW
jgi:hypothetical protein